jgi:type III restriction enzyme
MLTLKGYQQRALEDLRAYFAECARTGDADTSFYVLTESTLGQRVSYKPVRELPGLPYVCIRMPTGGGKTLVACHAIGVAAKDLLHADTPVVLWLVPSNAILQQTLGALKDRSHPYRQAVEADARAVNVLDVEEALYVKRADLNSGTTIIVSTIQSFRVEDTVGRRVYRDNGSLMDHFERLEPGIAEDLEHGEGGHLLHSLANVLQLRRPIVVVDEAHNARTDLSFETLSRFAPSCIIEFTATPAREDHPSNVLHTVSAAELKADEMIKMPIRLETRAVWKELLSDAVSCRKELEEEAGEERRETGEYIRPVMLLQAESRQKEQDRVTVEVVKECLVTDHRIPEDQIAVATGSQKDLEGVDVLSSGCPVRYVITVQALREGWDCPFAYVLCSVAEVRSTTCVEQILGRIMRLPQARWKQRDALNRAYAFSASRHFGDAAKALADALVQNGFRRQEARDLIVHQPATQTRLLPGGTFVGTVTVEVPEEPDVGSLPENVRAKTVFNREEGTLTFQGTMTAAEREALTRCFTSERAKECVDRAYRISRGLPEEDHGTPSERGEVFAVPLLAVKQGDLFEQFEETHFLDHPWHLSECSAEMSEDGFPGGPRAAEVGEVYATDNGDIKYRFISSVQERMKLFASDEGWTEASLVHWLDSNIPHPDIDPSESCVFLTGVVRHLIQARGITLAELVREKYRLRDAAAARIDEHRAKAKREAFQTLLAPDCETPLVVTPEVCFTYDPRQYPYGRAYRGGYKFRRHYYPEVGEFDSDEECACGQHIDQMAEVHVWVRNLSRRPDHSFWLPTSTDRFYPDFVAKVCDGRCLVVEYKGAHLWSNTDSREKRTLGELWMERSNGRCLFIMPKGPDFDAIDALVR